MSKLTLPIEIGRRYVRRDGKVVTAQAPFAAVGFANVGLPADGDGDTLVSLSDGMIAAEPAPLDLIADAPEEPKTFAITDYADVLRAIADGKTIQAKNYEGTDWVEYSSRDALGNIFYSTLDPDQLRVAPEFIAINGRQVPAPAKTPPRVGTQVWSFTIGHGSPVEHSTWKDGSDVMTRRLQDGLIHLTEEAARQHAEALLSFTRREG